MKSGGFRRHCACLMCHQPLFLLEIKKANPATAGER
jgi:hypothetical protein